MERVQKDDLDAFGEMFDRHQPPLYAFLCRIVGNAALAEDLTQEVFWKVWTHRLDYDPRRSFKVWLYAVARNAALDHLKVRLRETHFTDMPESVRSRLEEGGEGQHHRKARPSGDLPLQMDIRAALLSLPVEQRIAVALKEVEGHTYREIGEILGCSEGNARVLAHRGRLTLRDLLKAHVDEEGKPCLER